MHLQNKSLGQDSWQMDQVEIGRKECKEKAGLAEGTKKLLVRCKRPEKEKI